jgi:hypothetical protein
MFDTREQKWEIFFAVRMVFVQKRPARPTRYQPRATPWVNNGVDYAPQGQKHYVIHHCCRELLQIIPSAKKKKKTAWSLIK